MNAIIPLLIAICIFSLAYRYYAAFIAAKVLVLDDKKITPANEYKDGCDYIPTNKWIAFGHHFAAIAGAGPLIGPVLAAQFGWGPAFFWILLGSVFAGAVHDMIILFASVRHKGQSLAMIAKAEISSVTGIITSVITFFIIIITLAGVGVAVVNILFENPWGVFSIFMTIPIAMLLGIYLFKEGSVLLGSFFGVVLMCIAVFSGAYIESSSIGHWFSFDKNTLSILLPTYAFFAAVLPIWLLLTPRDYLSTYMKIGIIIILAVSLFFVAPMIKMPFTTEFMSGGGPIIKGPWWPYMFITIACGAISGFHALIGTGTTPKLLKTEKDIPLIGYGAMLSEGFVSIMALLAVVTLSPADYFAINASKIAFAKLNMDVVDLPKLTSLVGLDVSHRPGGGISLAVGMASIFSNFSNWLNSTMKYWFQFIIMFEALFILTLIDAGTRVARYILENILNTACAPLKRATNEKKIYKIFYIIVTSTIVSLIWGYLLYTGDISSLWPLFGTTNQALAALALALSTTVIIKTCKKKIYTLVTIVPCMFVFFTAMAACILNIKIYFVDNKFLNAWISIAIMVMITFVILDSIRTWIVLFKKSHIVNKD